jgi:pimeloyl-ACP methyl ester carboxylesterase
VVISLCSMSSSTFFFTMAGFSVQGFVVGSYGLTWALKNPSRVSKLVALNTPLTTSTPLPGIFQQLRFPLVGEFTCQNAILPERFVEAGSPYVLEIDDADVYRLPYLDSSDPGFCRLTYLFPYFSPVTLA